MNLAQMGVCNFSAHDDEVMALALAVELEKSARVRAENAETLFRQSHARERVQRQLAEEREELLQCRVDRMRRAILALLNKRPFESARKAAERMRRRWWTRAWVKDMLVDLLNNNDLEG